MGGEKRRRSVVKRKRGGDENVEGLDTVRERQQARLYGDTATQAPGFCCYGERHGIDREIVRPFEVRGRRVWQEQHRRRGEDVGAVGEAQGREREEWRHGEVGCVGSLKEFREGFRGFSAPAVGVFGFRGFNFNRRVNVGMVMPAGHHSRL